MSDKHSNPLQASIPAALYTFCRSYELDIDGNNIDLRVSITNYVVTETFTDYGTMPPIRFSRAGTKGRMKIYLNEELLDLENEVVLTDNGSPFLL